MSRLVRRSRAPSNGVSKEDPIATVEPLIAGGQDASPSRIERGAPLFLTPPASRLRRRMRLGPVLPVAVLPVTVPGVFRAAACPGGDRSRSPADAREANDFSCHESDGAQAWESAWASLGASG